METAFHQQLKLLALRWLHHHGCRIMATEVRCPISRFRVDVAAYWPPLPKKPSRHRAMQPEPAPAPPTALLPTRRAGQSATIIIECKQSRADFLHDRRDRDALLELRRKLHEQRVHLEETRVKPREPELRRAGSSLFSETDEWDLSSSQCRSYQCVLRKLGQVERQLVSDTKFSLLARYRLADRLYLLTPPGLIDPCELPTGWGLFETPPLSTLEACASPAGVPVLFHARWPAPEAAGTDLHRRRLLHHIAAAATRAAWPANPGAALTGA